MTPALSHPGSSRSKEADSPIPGLGPVQAASADFKAQVARWAELVRVKPRQIRLQWMRQKWASCSIRGTVSFSRDLLAQPEDFREYVIVHELLHLKVPNHGMLFKNLLRAYLPNYEAIRPPPSLDGPATGRTI